MLRAAPSSTAHRPEVPLPGSNAGIGVNMRLSLSARSKEPLFSAVQLWRPHLASGPAGPSRICSLKRREPRQASGRKVRFEQWHLHLRNLRCSAVAHFWQPECPDSSRPHSRCSSQGRCGVPGTQSRAPFFRTGARVGVYPPLPAISLGRTSPEVRAARVAASGNQVAWLRGGDRSLQ